MKLTFLGVSAFLADGFSSNALLESDGKTMLIDCGGDIKHSLKASGKDPSEIDSVYISHLHGDHSYGLEWLGFYGYFILNKKIKLYIHESLLSDLWGMLRISMERIKKNDEFFTISDYFEVHPVIDQFTYANLVFRVIPYVHIHSFVGKIYSYSLVCYDVSSENKIKFAFSTDISDPFWIRSPFLWWEENIPYIFHDCDVYNVTTAHPHYEDIKDTLKSFSSKKNVWFYHYHDLGDKMPDVVSDGFAGFVKQGQIFEI